MQQGNLATFTDVINDDTDQDEIANSQPLSLPSSPSIDMRPPPQTNRAVDENYYERPAKRTGQYGDFRSVEEIDQRYRDVFSYPYFNLVQSGVIEDALYSDKSMVVCAPTGSGKTVVFEMAIVHLLMELEEMNYNGDFKIIYMAPVKALCTERLSEWYPKLTKLGLMCIEVTGDTNVDFSQLKPYRVIITTPEKWDMLTRRWRDHRSLVEVIKLFLIDEVHILNDETRGPVLEAVVSRMKTIESSSQSAHRIEQLQKQYQENTELINLTAPLTSPPRIRFVAVSATISNPEDVAAWLGTRDKPAVYYKFGDECRPVKLKRIVEGYPCPDGMSIFKFDIILNYKLWPVIQKYHDGKPTLIFCNTRKSVGLTAETLARELTISFTPEQKEKLIAVASKIKNKKLQALVLSGVGCHHAGLLYEERVSIEQAFRNRDLPILITTTTLAMGVNLPAHLVIVKNTQQYVNGAYQEYSISTVLQMVGRAGRPQFDTEATAVIMTRLADKPRYQALVGGSEPLQSYLHKRLPENLNSEAALGTVSDVAQCVQWLRSTFLSVRAAKDPRRYLGLAQNAPPALISKKIEELCVKAMNGLASAGLITMDEVCCIQSTEAGRLMSIFYLDLETMKHIMKIEGTESIERLLWIICESHELADMHLRVDERRTLNTLNRNNAAATIRFPMKGKISSRQMKLNCIIQAVLGCLPIPDPSLNQEAMKVMRIADRICKCLVAYVTRPDLISTQPKFFRAVLNSLILAKCIEAHLWENSPYVSKQLKGIGPTFSTLLATAGKVNFNLLEESHPRDLERIMNKGAPAGNVLRKQVSLLPKYQLTATPIDDKKVNIQLLLLNQNHLAENRDQLTAGDSHKSYILVGDSENHLLFFTTFKDNELISIYDGVLTYEFTRKHSFEHKIFVHCISSNWVGIDAQCDYVFKGVEPLFARGEACNLSKTPGAVIKQTPKKQTRITDTYRERKRKNTEVDITQSKEKKKRETALIEKFKDHKNSFEITSRELKKDLQQSAQISNNILHEKPEQLYDDNVVNQFNTTNCVASAVNANEINMRRLEYDPVPERENRNNGFAQFKLDDDLNEEDNFVVDDRINSIMNEIENEIYKNKTETNSSNNRTFETDVKKLHTESAIHNPQIQSSFFARPTRNDITVGSNRYQKLDNFKYARKARKPTTSKTNYSFIDILSEANDNDNVTPEKDNGRFSETIKTQIEQFLKKIVKDTTNNKAMIESVLNYTTKPMVKLEGPDLETEFVEPFMENTDATVKLANAESGDEIVRLTETELKYDVVQEPATNTEDRNDGANTRYEIANTQHLETNDITVFNTDYETKTNNTKIVFNKCNAANFETDAYHNETVNEKFKLLPTETKDATFKYNYEIRECTEPNQVMSRESKATNRITKNENKDIRNDLLVIAKQTPRPQQTKIDLYKSMTQPQALPYKISSVLPNKSMSPYISMNNILTDHNNSFLNKPVPYTNTENVSKRSNDNDKIAVSYQTPNISIDISLPTEKVCLKPSQDDETINVANPGNIQSIPPEDYSPNNCQNFNNDRKTYNGANSKNINKYSFSATKFDVSTKYTPEHQVQIIRKIKLDLDVTEIVTKENNDFEKETNPFHGNTHNGENSESLRQFVPIIDRLNQTSDRLMSINNTIDIDKPMKDIIEVIVNCNKSELGTDKNDDIKNTETDMLQMPIGKLFDETNTSDPTKSNQTSENHNIYVVGVMDESNKNSKIGSILKKYSSILRKSNSTDHNKLENQEVIKNKTEVKPRRKFKLNDILNTEISLPETIVPNETKPKLAHEDILARIRNLKPTTKTDDRVDSSTVKFEAPPAIQEVTFNIDDFCQDQEYLSPAPEVSQLEAVDCDIDQSMLNPKTLLQQCFQREDNNDIIPPPTEFCNDENSYSQAKFMEDSPDPTQDVSHQYRDINDDCNKSIFDDDYPVLTPSREIETWTFSCGVEETYPSNMVDVQQPIRFNPPKSCTVMRQNSPVNQNPCISSRDQKFGKFKYMHKMKLKM